MSPLGVYIAIIVVVIAGTLGVCLAGARIDKFVHGKKH